MPIKLPRFRRKSVGNSLDATYQAAEPESPGAPRGGAQFSFDEIERPSQNQSNYSQYPQQQYHQQGYSTHLKYGDSTGSSSASRSNSNSGGSSGTGYYASDRQSSSSTLPSSADIPRTPPSTEDHYRPGFADSMNLKEPMAYGTTVTVPKTGWQNSKAGPMSKAHHQMGGPQVLEAPRLETSLDSEPLFGEDMFKFTADGKRMSAIGISDAVGPKVATSLFVPSRQMPIDPVPPVPPPKSVNNNSSRGGASGGRWLDLRIHGDDEDAYPSTPSSRYQQESSLPSPSIGTTRPSPSAKHGMYPWEARQDTEEDSLMSRDKSPSPGPPAPPPKKDMGQARHNRTLTPSTALPHKIDVADSLATPPQTGRAPRPTSGDLGLKRTLARGKGPTRSRSPVANRKQPTTYQGSDSHVGEDDDSVHSLSTVPTTKVTITSAPTISRVQTSPAIIQSDDLFSDSGSRDFMSGRPPTLARAGSEDMLTATLARDAAIASSFEVGESNRLKQPRKVFTKAQFERYKAQQEEERQYQAKNGEKSESDDESEVSEDDQDELEKQREQAKHRARQDAHLAVYRQQMMKITGSHGNDTTNLGMTNRGASNSTPMLSVTNQMPHLSISSPSSLGDKSDNEDEEVPLGILMAHGFPNKQSGRPPTRLSNSNSSPNLRSISGTTQFNDNGGAPSLPPFARHLPADPYFGASLVNQSNRVSMAPSSIYGGSQGGRESQFIPPPQPRPPQQRYPTGLIGNIVRDEELRAARKGGAQQAPFYNEALMSTPSLLSGTPSPPMQTPSETVSLQMASQMTQMMQLQMQWMQQMSHMNQTQQQQQLMAMQSMMPGMNPLAMMSAGNLAAPMAPGQRAMSMVDTGSVPQIPPGPGMMPPQIPGAGLSPGYAGSVYGHSRSSTLPTYMQPGYTPSIAPSERSNIGQPSRYRPVTYQAGSGNSSINGGNGGRSNTLTSAVPGTGLKASMTKDDSDDEDGWAELGKKKKEKQENWRRKKETGLRTVLKLGGN